jgi:selenocysteine-specific elongation factor
MMLTAPEVLSATTRADVVLTLLPDSKPLKRRNRMHFHAHTFEALAEVVPLEFEEGTTSPESHSGKTSQAFARIKLPEAALLVPGDRFILRQSSPMVTVGGGVVLDALPSAKKPKDGDFLCVLAGGGAKSILEARVRQHGRQGVSVAQLIRETAWTAGEIESLLKSDIQNSELLRAGDLIVGVEHVSGLQVAVMKAVEDFQVKNPLVNGMAREELRERLSSPEGVFAIAVAGLRNQGKIEAEGELVRLAGRSVVMKDEETESKRRIEEAFATAGLKVPALGEVLAGLKVDKARAQKIVTLLLRDKVLVKVSTELVFHRAALDSLLAMLSAHKRRSPRIDVAAFKEMTGVSRKYAIPLLEYLDRERVTRRAGDVREIL